MLQGNNSQSQSALDKVRWRKLPVEETHPPMFDPRSNSAWSSGSGGSISFGLGPGLGPEIPGSPINTNAGHNNNNKSSALVFNNTYIYICIYLIIIKCYWMIVIYLRFGI